MQTISLNKTLESIIKKKCLYFKSDIFHIYRVDIPKIPAVQKRHNLKNSRFFFLKTGTQTDIVLGDFIRFFKCSLYDPSKMFFYLRPTVLNRLYLHVIVVVHID